MSEARYRATLTKEEREALETITRSGKIPARKFLHARALLLCDGGEHGNAWKVADVAEALGVTPRTIEHLKRRFVEEGLESALVRKPRSKPREVHAPIAPAPGRGAIVDHEYVRNGTAQIFVEIEPLAGRRHIEVTETRTRKDWAGFIRAMLEERYPDAVRVRLVMDNRNGCGAQRNTH